ncbi:MAG: hypothetical protein IKL10_08255 [Clostridia bacterium]|nr:hypothetical protein [Clostridia bacterium]
MKLLKYSVCFIVCFMLFLLTACGRGGTNETTENNEDVTESTANNESETGPVTDETRPVQESTDAESVSDETEESEPETMQAVKELNFTAEDLMKANSVTAILDKYSSVKINTNNGESIKSIAYYNSKPFVIEVFDYDGVEEIFGWYDGFELKWTERGIRAEKYVETLFDADDFIYEDEISVYFDGYEFALEEETDTSYILTITSGWQDAIESRVYYVDKESLLLKKIVTKMNGEELHTTEYEYGEKVDDRGLIEDLNGYYKEVWLNCCLNNYTQEIKYTVEIPGEWEFIPVSRTAELNLYLKDDFSDPYVYPGDGNSFSLYCTDSVG